MSQPTTLKFSDVYVLLGDGGGTEIFSAPCGISQLTMTINTESSQTVIPDCDDLEAVAWASTDIQSMQMVISGSGLLAAEAMQTWQDWWYTDAGAEKNIRLFKDLALANGGGKFQGPAVLTAYEETGQRGEKWSQSFTINFNGKPTWTAASA